MASSSVTLKASGLRVSPNQLEVQQGSLQQAKNVVITRDDVIQSRRGYKLYGSLFGSATDRAKQLISYKSRLLRHYSNILQFQNGTVSDTGVDQFSSFSGTYEETEEGLRIKSIESNGNLYFTTSEGVKKLSASSSDDLSTSDGYIVNAGGVKAVDQTAELDITLGNISGFLPQDSAVAYRIVWGYKDLNNNLILGTPSQRSEVYNSLLELVLRDYARVLAALDSINVSGSLINDGDYVDTLLLPITATGLELRDNLLLLSTKIDEDILYADQGGSAPLDMDEVSLASNVVTITFDAGDPSDYLEVGSVINITGLTTGNQSPLNGDHVIASVDASSITFAFTGANFAAETVDATGEIESYEFRNISTTAISTINVPTTNEQRVALQSYLSNIITVLQDFNSNIIPTGAFNTYIDPLAVTTTADVTLTITIPQDINFNYFYQVYRSPVALATGTLVLETDVVPSDELQLVYEAFPTEAEIEASQIVLTDITPDSFRGAFLYTNETSGEGILQANELPPFAKDINRFKNVVFYANTRTRQALNFSMLGVQQLLDDYDLGTTPTLTIANSETSNTYSFVKGEQQSTQITTDTFANTTDSGYFTLYNANDEKSYYVWMDKTGSSTDPAPTGIDVGLRVDISSLTTAQEIADKAASIIAVQIQDFNAFSSSPDTINIVNLQEGTASDSQVFSLGGAWASTTAIDGVGEQVNQEISEFTTVADVAGSLTGLYFGISSAFTKERYYVWFRVNGAGADPAVADRTGVRIDLDTNDSADTVALKIANSLNEQLPTKFICSSDTNVLTIRTLSAGPTEDSIIGTSTFTLNITQQGALDVLLSSNVSPSIALDETTRSLVRVINKNPGEILYAYYISSPTDVPGKMFLQEKVLSTDPFYIVGNNSNTGVSFNPEISPTIDISSISTGTESTMVVTTSTAHGLTNLDEIIITNSDSINNIDGQWQVTVLSPTTFRVNQNISVAGTQGSLIKLSDSEAAASNEDRPNRVYYSKLNQPEAVPLLNFFDVGSRTKAILRIFPLRDTLFVFKEDGLFRISGESAPFTLSLFDGSCILLAPDSLGLSNNLVYAWTRQGISVCSEAGVTSSLSRDIDTIILPTPSKNPDTFKTATFGLGYESDNSYVVWTINDSEDEEATIAYRYSNLTNTWTTYDKTNTCGIINPTDDKMYLGAGDTNSLEQERKDFSRTDFADREFSNTLGENMYFGNTLRLSNVTNIKAGDVVVQDQTLTVYEFNAFLEKLDLDPLVGKVSITDITTGLTPTITAASHSFITGDYVNISNTNSLPKISGLYPVTVLTPDTFTVTLDEEITVAGDTGIVAYSYFENQKAEAGDNLRSLLVDLAQRLDIDPSLSYTGYESDIATKSGSITEITAEFPTSITTASPHELITGRILTISATDSSPTVNGIKEITVTGSNSFTVPVSVITPGTTGSYATTVSDFRDLEACYNKVISNLNNDVGASFANYRPIDNNTIQEAVVISVDRNAKSITLNLALDYIVGDFTVYESIETEIIYTPATMGDSLNYKQMYEATMMFANKAFTSATLSFATDLLPRFEDVPFRGTGNGTFGNKEFGLNYFGGGSHEAPFRTYVPRNSQRCRYIILKFTHNIARERYAIYGVTLTGNVQISSRAYR